MKEVAFKSSVGRASSRLLNITLFAMVLGSVGCGGGIKAPPLPKPETRMISVDRPARIPPGVVRYCWEEPMVEFEPNGPGLDVQRTWYSPAYIAVREVRQGRWRPCRQVPSEVKGETSNER